MSLCGGMGCGVVGLRNGDCAGRHGGAPASPYVGGHRRHQTTILLEVFFSFSFSLQGVPSCLLVLTSPRHGKEDDGDGDRRSIFFNVCASF